jgi:large subunit ribosomal protein L15
MNVDDVHRGIHKHRKRKRIGRGIGSGHGKTAGKGSKGQLSRAGWFGLPSFEGGQMPLSRRIPKRGFTNSFAPSVSIINVAELEAAFESGETVTPELLKERGVVKGRYDVLKVLGDGDLTKKLTVSAHRFSKSAKEKIERAGGQVVTLPGPAPVGKQKDRAARQAPASATPGPSG